MQKTVGLLTLTTIAFAASTLYLAYELHSRDTVSPDMVAAAAGAGPAPRSSQEPVASGATPSLPAREGFAQTTTPSVAGATGASPTAAAMQKKETIEATLMWARPFLARFDDSVQHGALLDETKTGIRRQYSRLKEQLKLSDATFDQLITQLAEEMLQAQEQFARCAVDPLCNPNDPSRRSTYIDHSQEYLALLGAEGHEAFTEFRNSIGERDQVIQLRGRLSDNNFLPEAQAEQLIKALADERSLVQQEAAQRGVSLGAWGTQLGMVYYSQDTGSMDQQLAEAQAYTQRMHARAAAMLSPAQLAAYAQMQEELLAQLATFLRPPARKANSIAAHST